MPDNTMQREHVEGGISFLVSADAGPGGFLGKWSCRRCGKTGTGGTLAPSADHALVQAISALKPHAAECTAQTVLREV